MKLDLKKTLGNLFMLVLILLLVSRVMAFGGDIQPTPVSSIESESMEPTLSVGDLVFWHPTTIDEVEEGDIIVFSSGAREDELIIHRVVEINETARGRELITQGDANPETDQERGEPPVREENFLGRPISLGGWPFHIPRIGYLWMWGGALFWAAIEGGVSAGGIAMLVPLLTAGVMLIVTVVFFIPEDDEDDDGDNDDELKRLILEEEKTRALQLFLIILVAFTFVIVPSTWYGSDTTTLSVGVEEEPEAADYSYSADRGEVIEGNQTLRNPGFTPLMHHIEVEGDNSEWVRVDRRNFRTEAGENSTVEFDLHVPQDAESGTYNKRLVNHHSSFWVIYPESFVGSFIESSPSHGVLMLNIFTSFIFAVITMLLMLLISYLIDEYIVWKEYHRVKKTIKKVEKKENLTIWDKLSNSKKRVKRKILNIFDWVRGVDVIDFEPKKPIYAGMIGLVSIPLYFLGAGLWSLFLLIPLSSISAYYLGCRWRAEIFTAALLCGGITALTFLYIPFAISYLSPLRITNIILVIQSLAVVILFFLILTPVILFGSYLTVMVIHKYRIKNSPEVVKELSDI